MRRVVVRTGKDGGSPAAPINAIRREGWRLWRWKSKKEPFLTFSGDQSGTQVAAQLVTTIPLLGKFASAKPVRGKGQLRGGQDSMFGPWKKNKKKIEKKYFAWGGPISPGGRQNNKLPNEN